MSTKNYGLDDHPKNLNQVNAFLNQYFYDLKVKAGEGYYYFYSEETQLALELSTIESTSVHIFRASQQTFEQWLKDAESVMQLCYAERVKIIKERIRKIDAGVSYSLGTSGYFYNLGFNSCEKAFSNLASNLMGRANLTRCACAYCQEKDNLLSHFRKLDKADQEQIYNDYNQQKGA